jgi:hypothetical protein
MKKNRIPTIVGFILLIFGLATGVILVQNRAIFRLGASSQSAPKNVRITNIFSDSFSVTWVTDRQASGFIKYGEEENSLPGTQTEESATPGFIHSAKLLGLKPEIAYFFKINSGESDFDNNGIPWQQQTGQKAAVPAKANLASGSVLTPSGSPSPNSLVYLTVNGILLSTLTSQNGSWVISIPFDIDPRLSLLEISVQAGPDGVSSAQIYPQSAKPVPAMILGQVYDFKNLPPSQNSDVPEAKIEIPDESLPSSGFNATQNTSTPSAKTVTLESVKEGEVITSVQPEFLGQGPAGTTINITIESDPIEGEVVIPKSGEWNWEIPKNLPEGIHKITIVWKDAAGITRTLTRNFVVAASEGPAFVATPSATLMVHPEGSPRGASPSATLTPTPAATVSATPFPQPDSGSLTPTVLLSIMGIGLVAISFLLWKKSYA